MTFPTHARPTLEELDAILKMPDHCDCCLNLKFSQNSALEKSDAQIAVECANRKQAPGLVDVLNGGTNVCAFLAMKICNKIINVFHQKIPSNGFKSIAEVAEEIILFFPQEINDFRHKDQTYDVLSAYNIMNQAKCLVTPYQFNKELVGRDGVFSPTGSHGLLSSMKQLGQVNFTAIYTCQPYIFVIGCLNGKPYVLETHPISCYSMFWCKDFHQNGNFFKGVDDESTNDFHSRKYSAQFYVYSNNYVILPSWPTTSPNLSALLNLFICGLI